MHPSKSRSRAATSTRAWLLVSWVAVGLGCENTHGGATVERGLSPEGIDRLNAVMQGYVDDERVGGIVTYVARHGTVEHLAAFGHADREAGRRMETDAIFRIASMTKAITTAAVMMLADEGLVALDDPVSKFLPRFGESTVAVPPGSDAPYRSVPAAGPMTIEHLLTHTSGLNYGSGPAASAYRAANVFGWYFADKDEPIGASIDRLATLPLVSHPGERFVYGFSTDVLGRVVEVVSGESLDAFFRTRIFEPLGMRDTYFYLPPEEWVRLASVYAAQPDGGIERAPDPGTGQGAYVDGPRRSYSGGAGLLSTAEDYGRFLELLRQGGAVDGLRLLRPETVDLMTTNRVGDLYGEQGFGLGFWIERRGGGDRRVGAYGWGGAYHTTYWVDPALELVAVLMTQLLPARDSDLHERFRDLVYAAIPRETEPSE